MDEIDFQKFRELLSSLNEYELLSLHNSLRNTSHKKLNISDVFHVDYNFEIYTKETEIFTEIEFQKRNLN